MNSDETVEQYTIPHDGIHSTLGPVGLVRTGSLENKIENSLDNDTTSTEMNHPPNTSRSDLGISLEGSDRVTLSNDDNARIGEGTFKKSLNGSSIGENNGSQQHPQSHGNRNIYSISDEENEESEKCEENEDDEEVYKKQMDMLMKKYYAFQRWNMEQSSSSDDDSFPMRFTHRFSRRTLEPWKEPETIEEKRALYACKDNYIEVLSLPTFPEYFVQEKLKKPAENNVYFTPNAVINKIISLWRGDSTCIECDAVVNAANRSLLGGGGIDGQIHARAGDHLLEECRKLNGCDTGFTKLTNGYRLPAKKILHTVGPTTEDPKALESCYKTCLELAKENDLRTVGFCCISTGIYGYPLRKATSVALRTVREFLETDENYKHFDRIVFIVYKLDAREERVYRRYIPRYFPLESYSEETEVQSDSEDETPRYPQSFNWNFYNFGDSSESSSEDDSSNEGDYFKTYFQNRGGKMPWE